MAHSALWMVDEIECSWKKISGAITGAARSVIDNKRKIKQPWMTMDTFRILQLKASARN